MNKPYALSAKAVVRDPRGRCLLLRRSGASKNNGGFWEFPGGKLDPGEQPDEALVREIREETGLIAEVVRVVGAGESELPDRKVAYLFFEARVDTDMVHLSPEHDAFQWVELPELKNQQLCPQYVPFARQYSVGAG
jgi:8-oxo-dGTP diphosphatase